MDSPSSFLVDHTKLKPGVYPSRLDWYGDMGDVDIVTLDIRLWSQEDLKFTADGTNKVQYDVAPRWFYQAGYDFEDWVSGLHSLEHTFATLLRTGKIFSDSYLKTVYIGPGGCLSMFYLVLAPTNIGPMLAIKTADGDLRVTTYTLELVRTLFEKTIEYLQDKDVPSTKPAECGNPSLHNSDSALFIAKTFLSWYDAWGDQYPKGDK